jgi:2-polyprenyl-3-methyl-5-hydroxy-6-metoxy-1,4-benzoquinol methylase
MISVVCVYNDQAVLEQVLLKSLRTQTAKYELITLDNTNGRFSSAAQALNYGGSQAKGDYIMFAHQDMWLATDTWLEDAERILQSIPDLGIAGVAGQSEEGRNWQERCRWSIMFDNPPGGRKPVQKAEEVQTLDECLLIVPWIVFSRLKFDEKVFDGWDCYGADYGLCVRQLALKAYVIPGSCSHSCSRASYHKWELRNLLKYQKRLYRKHKRNYKHIYTWMGEVSWLNLRLCEFMHLLGPVYLRLFPTWGIILKRELSGCDAVLDLGCGYHSPIQRFNIPFSVGVELFEPYLRESKRKTIHSQYIKADVRKLEFKPKSFDAVIALELLEHLTKQEGAKLINKMEKWAREKVIITTPNGYLWQNGYDSNPLQEHKSGWSIEELRDLGFKVRGIDGWKRLKGYIGSIRYKPAFLWGRVSDLSQRITYYYPKLAFRLFAIKRVGDGA